MTSSLNCFCSEIEGVHALQLSLPLNASVLSTSAGGICGVQKIEVLRS